MGHAVAAEISGRPIQIRPEAGLWDRRSQAHGNLPQTSATRRLIPYYHIPSLSCPALGFGSCKHKVGYLGMLWAYRFGSCFGSYWMCFGLGYLPGPPKYVNDCILGCFRSLGLFFYILLGSRYSIEPNTGKLEGPGSEHVWGCCFGGSAFWA